MVVVCFGRLLRGSSFVVPRLGHPLDGVLFCALPVGEHRIVILLGKLDKTVENIRKRFPFRITEIDEAQKTEQPHVLGFLTEQLSARRFHKLVVNIADLADFCFACVKIGIVIDVCAHRAFTRYRLYDQVKEFGNRMSSVRMRYVPNPPASLVDCCS
jgi:hypothetical protein